MMYASWLLLWSHGCLLNRNHQLSLAVVDADGVPLEKAAWRTVHMAECTVRSLTSALHGMTAADETDLMLR